MIHIMGMIWIWAEIHLQQSAWHRPNFFFFYCGDCGASRSHADHSHLACPHSCVLFTYGWEGWVGMSYWVYVPLNCRILKNYEFHYHAYFYLLCIIASMCICHSGHTVPHFLHAWDVYHFIALAILHLPQRPRLIFMCNCKWVIPVSYTDVW